MLKPLAQCIPLPTLCCYCRGGEDERDGGLNWTPTQQYYFINRLSLSIKVITRICLAYVSTRTGAFMCTITDHKLGDSCLCLSSVFFIMNCQFLSNTFYQSFVLCLILPFDIQSVESYWQLPFGFYTKYPRNLSLTFIIFSNQLPVEKSTDNESAFVSLS